MHVEFERAHPIMNYPKFVAGDKDQDKGDELLRRLLKTPPDHRQGKKPAPAKLEKKSAKSEQNGDG